MKGMKGKILKKLKSVKPIGYLKTDRILQVTSFDVFVDNFPLKSAFNVENFSFKPHFKSNSESKLKPINDEQELSKKIDNVTSQEPEVLDVSELVKDLEEDEFDSEERLDRDKENVTPRVSSDDSISTHLEERFSDNSPICSSETKLNDCNFRRPDMNSGTLFDPNLLEAFQQAVTDQITTWEAQKKVKNDDQFIKFIDEKLHIEPEIEDGCCNLLSKFEDKCPPKGKESVILYTTSLRGIRKTFEDCHSIRFLLESFRVVFYERDVSIHSKFRDEMWRTLGQKLVPPRLFIKGRYIGGAEEVLGLHEQGRLRALFEGIPFDFRDGPCRGCGGFRFIMCYNCNGSRKTVDFDEGNAGPSSRCPECNENGLIVCSLCC